MHEMKRIRILADPYLFVLTAIALIAVWSVATVIIVLTSKGCYLTNGQLTRTTRAIVWMFFVAMALSGSIISFFVDTRWANVLVLSHQKIELRSCFKKPVVYAYEEYPYIYRATYRHSIVGAPDVGPEIVYLVLSRRRLSSFEKTHINQVSSATDVIKIKFSKSRYQLLLESMPPKLSREVERTFAPYI